VRGRESTTRQPSATPGVGGLCPSSPESNPMTTSGADRGQWGRANLRVCS
jgi:hypothetical protein